MENFQNFIEFRSDITSSEHFRLVSPFFCDKSDLGCKRTDYVENTWVMVKVRHKKGCGTTSLGTISSSICGQSYLALNGVKKALHECDDIRRIGDEIEALDENSIPALEGFMMRYQNVLHPNHYHCLGVLHLLCQLYGKAPGYLINNLTETQLRHKRNLCRQLLKVVDVLEPGYSRLRGKFCTIKNKL